MPKIGMISTPDKKITHPYIFCPACGCIHVFDSRWSFNGDKEKPTFKPSMLVHENPGYRKRSNDKHGHRCHSFVTDGRIRFLGDCTHKFAGQEVELPDIDKQGE